MRYMPVLVCMFACTRTRVCVCACTRMCVCACMRVCVWLYICVWFCIGASNNHLPLQLGQGSLKEVVTLLPHVSCLCDLNIAHNGEPPVGSV